MDPFDPYQQWLDIPPDERPVDHYRLLGLPRFESRPEVIEQAADQRMAHVRKFQTGPRGRYTQDLLNQLASAKLCLLDEQARQRYDDGLRNPRPVPSARPAPNPVAPNPVAPGSVRPVSGQPSPPVPPQAAPPVAHQAEPPVPPPPVASARAVAPSSAAGFRVRSARSVAAVRRRRSSGAGCLLMLTVIALVLGGFIFLLLFSRQDLGKPARPQRARNSAGSPIHPPSGQVAEQDDADSAVVVWQETTGAVNLPASVAVLHGESVRLGNKAEPNVIVDWTSLDDWIQWEFYLARPGVFQAEVHYTIDRDAAGGRYEMLVDGRTVKLATLRAPEDGQTEVVDQYFVAIRRGGPHMLAIRPVSKPGEQLMRLFQVRLVPSQGAPTKP